MLEAGDLRLDRDGGSFVIRYFDHVVPVSPRTLDDLLGRTAELFESDELASLAVAFGRLPPANATDEESVIERHRDKEVLRGQLARLLDENPHLARAVDGAVATTNADFDALDALIDRQNYRLSYWRSAGQELDYRRFFDVPTLIGLRIERRRIFTAAHEKVLDLVQRGLVDGLRVDHIDGLRYPAGYLQRLRDETADSKHGGTYVVVEKILEHGEALPATWPVAGTTGYDFLNVVAGLFVDPAGEEPLTRLYGEVTGRGPEDPPSWDDAVAEGKNLVLREVLGADVNNLVNRLVTVCEQHRRYRDYTRRDLHGALWEVLACFPVYRTYVQPGESPTEADVAVVETAVAAAADRRPQIDPELFTFLRRPAPAPGAGRGRGRLRAALPAGHRAGDGQGRGGHRLLPLQPAGQPQRRGRRPRPLRDVGRRVPRLQLPGRGRLAHHHAGHVDPRHQAQRGRAGPDRPAVGDPGRVGRHRPPVDADERPPQDPVPDAAALPDANTEYLLYQTLVGAFPLSVERAVAYMEKASREAKEHTSWIDPEPAYDDALRGFIEAVLADPGFAADLAAFVAPLVDAGPDGVGGPGPAQAHLARRARPLPGHRGVGPEPGRPRQPPPGRLRRPPRACWRRSGAWRRPTSGPWPTRGRPSCGRCGGRWRCAGSTRRRSVRRGRTSRWRRPASGPTTWSASCGGDGWPTVVPRLVIGLAAAGGWGDTDGRAAAGDCGPTCSGRA